jgi:cell division control protein 6
VVYTGDIYNEYWKVCDSTTLRPLTHRRVSDIIADLDMQGLINAKVISKGRFGRTREISVALPDTIIPEVTNILTTELGL